MMVPRDDKNYIRLSRLLMLLCRSARMPKKAAPFWLRVNGSVLNACSAEGRTASEESRLLIGFGALESSVESFRFGPLP